MEERRTAHCCEVGVDKRQLICQPVHALSDHSLDVQEELEDDLRSASEVRAIRHTLREGSAWRGPREGNGQLDTGEHLEVRLLGFLLEAPLLVLQFFEELLDRAERRSMR